MKRVIVFRRVARREFDDAMDWYDARRVGLGGELKQEVDQFLKRIAANPEQFPKTRVEVRRVLLRRFPYSIHYLTESKRIVVLAVFHFSRDPQQLEDRY